MAALEDFDEVQRRLAQILKLTEDMKASDRLLVCESIHAQNGAPDYEEYVASLEQLPGARQQIQEAQDVINARLREQIARMGE